MKKKISRCIAGLMLAAALGFIFYALGHPEAYCPWNGGVTYTLYGAYGLLMVLLFIAPFKDREVK